MSVRPFQSSLTSLGHFDILDTDLAGLKGGEILVFERLDAGIIDQFSPDILRNDGYRTLLRLASTMDTGPFFLAANEEEVSFNAPGFELTSLYAQNKQFGQILDSSGKVGIYAEEGFYSVNSDVVDTTTVNINTDVYTRLYADASGHLTTNPSVSGAIVGFFIEFHSGSQLRGFPNKFEYPSTHRTGDSIIIYKTVADGYFNINLVSELVGSIGQIGTPTDGYYGDGYVTSLTSSTTIADGIDVLNEALLSVFNAAQVATGNPSYDGPGSAVRLYVEKTGNDTTGTGTIASPFRTLHRAIREFSTNRERVSRIRVGLGDWVGSEINFDADYKVIPPLVGFDDHTVHIEGSFSVDLPLTVNTSTADGYGLLADVVVNEALSVPGGFILGEYFLLQSFGGTNFYSSVTAVDEGTGTITVMDTAGFFFNGQDVRLVRLGTNFDAPPANSFKFAGRGWRLSGFNFVLGLVSLQSTVESGFSQAKGIEIHGCSRAAGASQWICNNIKFNGFLDNINDTGGNSHSSFLDSCDVENIYFGSTGAYEFKGTSNTLGKIIHLNAMSSTTRAKIRVRNGFLQTFTGTVGRFGGTGTALFLEEGSLMEWRYSPSVDFDLSHLVQLDTGSKVILFSGTLAGTTTGEPWKVREGSYVRGLAAIGLGITNGTTTGDNVTVGAFGTRDYSDLPLTDIDELVRVT